MNTKALPAEFGNWTIQQQTQWLSSLPEFRESREAQEAAEQLAVAAEQNPLLIFKPHEANAEGKRPQLEFIEAMTSIVAALAGNQFGKSTALTVCALRECLPSDLLPPLLRRTKRYEPPVDGWILCPTEDKIFDSFQPAFEEWCPKAAFKGGSWGKAFNGARMLLSFANGSTIAFKTYKQDPSTLGGARLHFVGYDEPPPKKHREESRMRLVRYGGYELFAMTPLDTNTGYIRKEIWKKREAPHVTVVRGSIHDNPTLDKQTVAQTLGDLSDVWRQAREFGDFVDMGGLIYPEFDRCVQEKAWSPAFIRTLDVVVGIDDGIRNCGLVWVGFDKDLTAHVFHAELLQDKTPLDYVACIKAVNERYGLGRVAYVIDPAAQQRAKANGMTVLSEINKAGVYPNLGQNNHELGFGQMRIRMAHGRFKVSPGPECIGLRDEADDYAAKEPEEGRDDSYLEPVKGNDHRLDALRYAVLERFWDPVMEEQAPLRQLGFDPGRALPAEAFRREAEVGPMGSMG